MPDTSKLPLSTNELHRLRIVAQSRSPHDLITSDILAGYFLQIVEELIVLRNKFEGVPA